MWKVDTLVFKVQTFHKSALVHEVELSNQCLISVYLVHIPEKINHHAI